MAQSRSVTVRVPGKVNLQLAVGEDGWCERAKAFAKLDAQIERALHARRPGIAEDRARAQRARAEFHPSLEPADRLLRNQRLDRSVNQSLI